MAEQEEGVVDQIIEGTEPLRDIAEVAWGAGNDLIKDIPTYEEIPVVGPGMDIVNGGMDIYKGFGEAGKGDMSHAYADGVGGVASIGKGAADLMKGTLGEENVGTAGRVMDVISGVAEAGAGAYDIATDEGYGGQTLDGIHDLLSGGCDTVSGIAGETPVGAVAKGIGAGMKIGDAVAPLVFHDAASKGLQEQEVPADGFRAGTGNQSVDGIIHGAQDLADGNFGKAGGELLQGAGTAMNLAVNPWGAVATEAISGGISSLWE